MASNTFGNLFKILTWGESHGKAIGVVIDGCPAGLDLDESVINRELARRAPGKTPYTSPRKEKDQAEILSGVFDGKTTGAPISILIPNGDVDSSKYEPIKDQLRPGHANYTYLEKYGIFDYRGGGRASARETATRVAAGAVAKQLLKYYEIEVMAYLQQVGEIQAPLPVQSQTFCPDQSLTTQMVATIEKAKTEGDSLGGVVGFMATALPAGLGDPVYEKLEANLARAMMSLPATKAFEIGSGAQSATMRGSEHNDCFTIEEGKVVTETNSAGGTLGGISTGMPLVGKVVFKPTSSINKAMKTVTTSKKQATFQLPKGSRHDPCVAIRAVPVVEAMLALVLADAILMNRCSRL